MRFIVNTHADSHSEAEVNGKEHVTERIIHFTESSVESRLNIRRRH